MNLSEAMLSRIETLETELSKYKCPIGLEETSPSICSAGYCYACVAARFQNYQARIETLEKALEPFAASDLYDAYFDADSCAIVNMVADFTHGDFEAARAALPRQSAPDDEPNNSKDDG